MINWSDTVRCSFCLYLRCFSVDLRRSAMNQTAQLDKIFIFPVLHLLFKIFLIMRILFGTLNFTFRWLMLSLSSSVDNNVVCWPFTH